MTNIWIVIECFPDAEHASIVINEDGSNKVFHDCEEAQREADNCQDGMLIALFY